MIPEIIKNTNAYKVIKKDKKSDLLSHAYLLVCEDERGLDNYLNILARLIMCESEELCDDCRTCKLIAERAHPDVSFYPKKDERLNVAAADEIVENSIIKPLETKNRLFVLSRFDELQKSQNKLLKTLEEPPKGVILLLGTTNETAILPTVKSRAKQLYIPQFSFESLFEEFKDKYPDENRLKKAVALASGSYFEVENNYERGDLAEISQLCIEVLKGLNSSRDVLYYSSKLKSVEIKTFIAVLKLALGDLVRIHNGMKTLYSEQSELSSLTEKFKLAALLTIIEKTSELEKALQFNANKQMLLDKLLFGILEGKYKWQKLQA